MRTLNKQSKEFIKWGLNLLENDDQVYQNLLYSAHQDFKHFLSLPKEEILKRLKKKLLRGSREHGLPIYSKKRIKKEIKDEHIDLLGWPLVYKYNLHLKRKAPAKSRSLSFKKGDHLSPPEKNHTVPSEAHQDRITNPL